MKTNLNLNSMKSHSHFPILRFAAALVVGVAGMFSALAQTPFDSGSDGSFGDLIITNNTHLQMPPDGVFKCKIIDIQKGVTLTFAPNAANTPVYLLATGDVFIDGTIDISGGQGNSALGGLPGPGGFGGGHPGFGPVRPGAGFGPGGGLGGIQDSSNPAGAGAGGYLYRSGWGASTNHGQPYGTPVLIPLVGGSGGGGTIQGNGGGGNGGGGGGGAILIASNTKIDFSRANNSGVVQSVGGNHTGTGNGGSGGAVRFVAPTVIGIVRAFVTQFGTASDGRVRIDTVDATQMGIDIRPGVSGSRGTFLITGLSTNTPQLNIVQVGSQTIPAGQVTPVSVLLPNGTSPTQPVTVLAKNFGSKVPVNVVLTPDSGDPIVVALDIDNTSKNPATATVNVNVPINVPVTLNAWTR
ncbi:MAG: hypothetical protein HY043_20770 [Verrucomicrobia bacterium]|nr:hypothetical protein [Verrucomicrobiota bacterium]